MTLFMCMIQNGSSAPKEGNKLDPIILVDLEHSRATTGNWASCDPRLNLYVCRV